MLLVLASRHDQSAIGLVDRWRSLDARLMTCRDLSRAGWRYHPDDPRSSRAVLGDEIIPFEQISGVMIRTPWIEEAELGYIEPADRGYVASEMNAFLTAWLSGASFPVINRPTANCLLGPAWSPTRWLHEAARAGLRMRARRASAEGEAAVAVVGDKCFGSVDGKLAEQAKRLALAARVQTMTVIFSGADYDAEFVRAELGVNLDHIQVADALFDCFAMSAAAVV